MTKRKLIQITSAMAYNQDKDAKFMQSYLYGLADDGSVWLLPFEGARWEELPSQLDGTFLPPSAQ